MSEAIERILQSGTTYSEVSVERLCRETGVSRVTFYQYFQDKADLLSQIAEATLRSLSVSELFWPHLSSRSDKEALRNAFGKIFAFYREHRGVMRSLTECGAHDSTSREHLRNIVDWAIRETTRCIEEGIRHGTVRPHPDPETRAEWLCWMFERGLYEVAGDLTEDDLERMLTAATGIVWNVLYRRTSAVEARATNRVL